MVLISRRNYGLNLFDEFLNDSFFIGSTEKNSGSKKLPVMRADITERDGDYIMEIELPEFKKEDIKAGLKDGYLIVSAEHNASNESKDDEGAVIHRERYTSPYKRAFFIGEHTRQEDIKTSFEDNILKLQISKDTPRAKETPKYIDIL